jgi:hypothetical protein
MIVMSGLMSKADLRAWTARWELVNERQREEARRMTPAQRFIELSRLMVSARMFPMSRRNPANDAARELWVRLQRRMLGRE